MGGGKFFTRDIHPFLQTVEPTGNHRQLKKEVDTHVSPLFLLPANPSCPLRRGQGPDSDSALMTGVLRQTDHSGPKELRAFDPLLRCHTGLFFLRWFKGLPEGMYAPSLTFFLPEGGGSFRKDCSYRKVEGPFTRSIPTGEG